MGFGCQWACPHSLSERHWRDVPSTTLPKTTWRPSRWGVSRHVIKNCEPFVLAPAFAMDSRPVCQGRDGTWFVTPTPDRHHVVNVYREVRRCRYQKHAVLRTTLSVLDLEVLVLELLAVDAESTSTVTLGEVATLRTTCI